MGEGGSLCLQSRRPRGEGWVLEVSWIDAGSGLSRLRISRRGDAFHGVTLASSSWQGAKVTHKEFFFNLLLGSMCERKETGEPKVGEGGQGWEWLAGTHFSTPCPRWYVITLSRA